MQLVSGGGDGGAATEFQIFANKTLKHWVSLLMAWSRIRGWLGEIEGVAKQTNLLALNAVINQMAAMTFALISGSNVELTTIGINDM